MGEDVSKSTVSRVTKRLEENVETLRQKPITGPVPYLFLDATFLDARWARRVENVAALVAYGVGLGGKRELLAITIGAQKSEASWTELLRQLTDRGLHGVELVIADDHKGLGAAVRANLSEAELQRCTVHFMRNVLTKTPARVRGRVAKELSAIFKSKTFKQAKELKKAFERRWVKHVPEAVECLNAGFPAATRYFAFPEAHHKRIRSTNDLERLHGEIKRRTRAVGAFPDRASALRLVTAVALHATAIWSDRRYLDMTLLPSQNLELRQAA